LAAEFVTIHPMRTYFAAALVSLPVVISVACGGSTPPPANPDPAASTSVATTAPTHPPCSDAPFNPGDVMTKEPAVLNACFASAGKITPNFCGSAKIAVEIGKDGRVTRAEVADSTLPEGVTECMKARLANMQFACPKEGSGTYTIPVGMPVGGCPGMPGAAPAPAPVK
jgi:hypothetical protein